MNDEIKEILKIDKQLLDKIENILGTELSNEEYDIFYNYFNEIRKPNILIDIKGVESIKDYITNLQEENKILKQNAINNDKVVDEVNWKNKKLQNKIDKVIEYINRYLPNYDFDHSNLEKILEILEGDDNEDR